MTENLFLGIETGGTKILAKLEGKEGIVATGRWPTTTADDALESILDWIAANLPAGAQLAAAGVAAFGPLIIDPMALDYGLQLATPKPGWAGSNLRSTLAARLSVPVRVDTDVNAAARAELVRGAETGITSLAYLTIGTGIGAGLANRDGTLSGALHPELGHLRLVRAPGDTMQSACPFHADCAEGLAAGPALKCRLTAGETLETRPDLRSLTASYIAQLCAAMVLAWSPHRIVIGGGVGTAPGLLAEVRTAFTAELGDYGVGPAAHALDFLSPPAFADAGIEGALLMARDAFQPNKDKSNDR